MKHIIKALTVLAAIAVMASCNKDSQQGGMSVEEQISYMDNAGEEALSQIEPTDFQELANIINDIKEIKDEIEFDEQSQLALTVLAASMLKYEGSDVYLLIDCDKINGTVTINGEKATYTTGEGKKVIFKAGTRTYTADISATSGSQKVKLGTRHISVGSTTQEVDVYLLVPTAISADIYYNSKLYMGGQFNIDASKMPSDWSTMTIAQINASVSGSLFLGGKGSYSIDISELSLANKIIDANASLYGDEGAFLAKADFSCPINDDGTITSSIENLSLYANIINKVEASLNSSTTINCYLDGTPYFTIDSDSGLVSFTDGTKMQAEDMFTQENFPKTFTAATVKYLQFAAIFGM